MRALAGQERPEPADAGAIERRAVGVLAITIIIVAIPIGSGGQFALEQGVDGRDRIEDARIVGGAQAEPHISERIRAHQKRRLPALRCRQAGYGSESGRAIANAPSLPANPIRI